MIRHKYYISQRRLTLDGTVYEFAERFGERIVVCGWVCFICKEKDGWRVTEATSGRAIGLPARTKKEALADARWKIAGAEKLEEVVKENISVGGRSPWREGADE
jgi:phage tail sheath protein FI